MNKIENYLGVANHDIQMANNSQELKSYVASILCENDELQQENQKYKEVMDNALSILRNELYKSRCRCDACNDYFIENLIKLLEQKEVE